MPTSNHPPSESEIQAAILRELGSRPDCRLFRNVTAQGWAGPLIRRYPNGSVLIANARPLHAGLIKGSGDLIGWLTRNPTDQSDPSRLAQFLSLEIKTDIGQPSPDQLNWQRVVREFGGIAGVVRSVDEALGLLV